MDPKSMILDEAIQSINFDIEIALKHDEHRDECRSNLKKVLEAMAVCNPQASMRPLLYLAAVMQNIVDGEDEGWTSGNQAYAAGRVLEQLGFVTEELLEECSCKRGKVAPKIYLSKPSEESLRDYQRMVGRKRADEYDEY